MGIIYKITSPTGRFYIGQTKCKRTRFAMYRFEIKRGRQKTILFRSLNKYGWDAHITEIIEEVDNDKLLEREVYWISELKSYWQDNPLGMNMTRGGEAGCGSWMHKTELRKWFSEKYSGSGGPFYGKGHTEEAKKVIAEKASKRNLERGITVPRWGAEKGRLKVIRAIVCYNLKGQFLKEYDSLSSASKELGIDHSSIVDSCKQRKSQAKGYIFRYKNEGYPLKIDIGVIHNQSVKKPIYCFWGSYTLKYPSAEEASKDLKVPKTTIARAAQYNKLKPIRNKLIFAYVDEYDALRKAV